MPACTATPEDEALVAAEVERMKQAIREANEAALAAGVPVPRELVPPHEAYHIRSLRPPAQRRGPRHRRFDNPEEELV